MRLCAKILAEFGDIEACLQSIIDKKTFLNRKRKKIGSVDVRFTTEKEAIEHLMKTIRSGDLTFLPT